MNALFATPGLSGNPVLKANLPFINMNGVNIDTTVPPETSKYQCKFL